MKTIVNLSMICLISLFITQAYSQVNADIEGDQRISGSSRIAETAITPNARTVYGNSMPLAYGSIFFDGGIDMEYGIQSVTRTGTGIYEVVLDNAWIGGIAANATIRFGGHISLFTTVTYEYDTASKTVTIYIEDGSAGIGVDHAFSIVVYGTPVNAGSGCPTITSPTGLAQAPNDMLTWYVNEDPSCVTAIPFAFGGPNPNAIVNVKGFVGAGTGTVEVDLEFDSPLGGTILTTVNLTSAGLTQLIGTYIAANGTPYYAFVILGYDGVQFVDATIQLIAQ